MLELKCTYYHKNELFGNLAKFETKNYLIKIFSENDKITNIVIEPRVSLLWPEVSFYNGEEVRISVSNIVDFKFNQIDTLIERLKEVKELTEYVNKNKELLKNGIIQ